MEQGPALALWLARFSGAVDIAPFHVNLVKTPDGPSLLGWPDALQETVPERDVILVLGEPHRFPMDVFLLRLNADHPRLRALGGMASGVHGPGDARLLLGDQVVSEGAVGVLLRGEVRVRSIVSQGCRPIGRPMVVTRARDNVIAELGGKAPLVQLRHLWEELNSAERRLVEQGLHVGRVIDEYRSDFGRGDFLIRNVLGIDEETGAVAITDRVRVGQTIQFQVRDARTADEDLHALMRLDRAGRNPRGGGALLFTCNGRGTRLFSEPHHDARVVRGEAGAGPLAGFFAQGEIGPVGGQNFMHGFTASVALFEE